RLERVQAAARTFCTTRDEGAMMMAQQTMRRERRAVIATFDLGRGLLNHGQSLGDADAPKKTLEKAEKTFLSIASVAGQAAEFRLNLGEVYYWLGKHDEGRKLFDEHLTDQARSTKSLLEVAQRLRSVGAVSEGSTLAEEAYNKENDQ